MTARVPLPGEEQVQRALDELTEAEGQAQTVIALARSLGLANSTFWRYFPDVARTVAQQRREQTQQPKACTAVKAQPANAQDDVARLRRRNQVLSEHLEVALAQLQRLTLENDALREALEGAREVARFPRRLPG